MIIKSGQWSFSIHNDRIECEICDSEIVHRVSGDIETIECSNCGNGIERVGNVVHCNGLRYEYDNALYVSQLVL